MKPLSRLVVLFGMVVGLGLFVPAHQHHWRALETAATIDHEHVPDDGHSEHPHDSDHCSICFFASALAPAIAAPTVVPRPVPAMAGIPTELPAPMMRVCRAAWSERGPPLA